MEDISVVLNIIVALLRVSSVVSDRLDMVLCWM